MTAVLLIITWFVLGYIGARAFLEDGDQDAASRGEPEGWPQGAGRTHAS